MIKFYKVMKYRQGIFYIFIGLLFFAIFNFIAEVKSNNIGLALFVELILPASFLIFGIIQLTNKFIRSDRFEKDLNNNIEIPILYEFRKFLDSSKRKQNEIDNIVENLNSKIKSYEDFTIPIDDKKQIIEEFKTSISKNLTDEFFSDLKLNLSNTLIKNRGKEYSDHINAQKDLRYRLLNEVKSTLKIGNINFFIGLAFASFGLLYLFYINFSEGKFNKISDLNIIVHYSILILFEILAFFFLRLYRYALIESKHFQNELSSIELKIISLNSAINFGSEKDLSSVISELSKSERNLIFKKGEFSSELKKMENENFITEKIYQVISNLNLSKNIKN